MMQPLIEELADALRTELQQYGELLVLLEEQQSQVIERNAEAVLMSAAEVDQQTALLTKYKAERDRVRTMICQAVNLGSQSTVTELIPHLPEVYRPLLQALVEENQLSAQRIGRLARQNHLLMTQSMEMMNHLIHTMSPETNTRTYARNGFVATPSPSRTTYEQVC
jgi:flagellar biosynthesis/type III secretory pathway chaperone